MRRVRGFKPVVESAARVLILGSMPGRASLAAGQYYAHPRNAFRRLLGELLGFDPALPYAARLRLLKKNGIALWDVLGSCVRPGSLDSAIEKSSVVPNDLSAFLRRHPGIRRVLFNGSKAEECFNKYVLPSLPRAGLEFRRLPSTSPAHASKPYPEKLKAWRRAL
ncbi:MAG: DNA-deoxyinosine glycosylase [Elusimicrobia bacterium]|nr:DNA-deoxyinosine glycosylase [Elusimicrobiota bacterium]